ncbi:alpha-methylacyl-CoA racemase [Alcanivorax hongdengensis A-11-3]|uniref:Alpha-methylacyl-CoA racemase n=1 Tax=Alcanivorax hongdengensis A-11-3 TaxID=1177179 RepID=L0WIJ9_9GAMM|nr:CaiB/BaiF CoA-transferase family protein [Alcanivorax hongdengensis]EKF75977.1 alpha-methylacyl-CoA racemase [Alcanivorax hongdengensis A-11-3]
MNPLLDGLKVLDLSRLLPGPFCSLTLAQLGAEVIKIEEPDGGDYARELSPELFDIVNRGKQSITLDLRLAEDVEHFKAMVKNADVVLESFRPGVMDKLGCGYDTLRAINPKLVYASLTGYGQTGPYADRPGHDLNYLGYAGVLDQTGLPGKRPAMSNVQIADLAGGAQNCAIGILAAVMGARQSGEGCWVDVGMLDGALALQSMALATHHQHGSSQPRGKDMLTGALANYNIYRCRDGRYLAVGSLEPKFFMAFLKEITPAFLWRKKAKSKTSNTPNSAARTPKSSGNDALTKLAGDPKKLRRLMVPVRWAIQLILLTRTRDQWEARLAHKDTCVSAILTLEEALANEQVQARELMTRNARGPVLRSPIRFVNAQTRDGDSPALGQHNPPVEAPRRRA